MKTCSKCGGYGKVGCSRCGGRGKITETSAVGYKEHKRDVICPNCGGSREETCPNCGGLPLKD